MTRNRRRRKALMLREYGAELELHRASLCSAQTELAAFNAAHPGYAHGARGPFSMDHMMLVSAARFRSQCVGDLEALIAS